MGGLMSRRKGMKNEYLLRDYFRALGYESFRVPLSGASEGYKGDVIVTIKGVQYPIELKVRKDEFKSVYALHRYVCHQDNCVRIITDSKSFVISSEFNKVHNSHVDVELYGTEGLHQDYRRGVRKALSLEQYVKGCHMLAIRINNEKFLFLKYENTLRLP